MLVLCPGPTDVEVTQLTVTPLSLSPGTEVTYNAAVKVTVAAQDSVGKKQRFISNKNHVKSSPVC